MSTSRTSCGSFFPLVFQVRTISVRSDLRARFTLSLVILFLSVIVCDPRTRSTARLLIHFDPLVRPSGSVIPSVDRLSLLIETLVDYQVKSTGTPGSIYIDVVHLPISRNLLWVSTLSGRGPRVGRLERPSAFDANRHAARRT